MTESLDPTPDRAGMAGEGDVDGRAGDVDVERADPDDDVTPDAPGRAGTEDVEGHGLR